jgi:hypothetical protein
MAEVVRRRPNSEQNAETERAGLRIDMDNCRRTDSVDGGLASETYRDIYLSARFPRLKSRREVSLPALDQLFQQSGYLALREGEGLSKQWHEFHHPRSADLAFVDGEGTPIGHVSVTQGYRKTWLLHQLATLKDQEDTGRCRQELYGLLSCGPTLLGGQDALALAYFNQERYWHRKFFGEFLEWTSDETLAGFCVWDRLEPGPERPDRDLPHGYEVRPLMRHENAQATALVRSSLPTLVSDCLDVTPHSLDFRETHIMPERQRHCFGLFKDGRMGALALCETGPAGSSIFNIFNMGQVLVRRGESQPSSDAQLAFLSRILRFYDERGVTSPLLVSGPDHLAESVRQVIPRAEQMGCVGMSNAGLRRWETYCQIQMGRLYAAEVPSDQARSAAE